MAVVSATIQGGKALERKLTRLPSKVARKVVKKALLGGANLIKKATKATAPKDTGRMRRALIVRAARKNKPGTSAYFQLFNTQKYPELVKASRAGKRAFYPSAVEYGHAAPGKAGGVKIVKATEFVRRAFARTKTQAERQIINDLNVGIKKAWAER